MVIPLSDELKNKIREYLKIKFEWKNKHGFPNRIRIREKFKYLESFLLDRIPFPYEIDGYVLTKGFLRKGTMQYPYISVYTDESWNKVKSYSTKTKEKENDFYYGGLGLESDGT